MICAIFLPCALPILVSLSHSYVGLSRVFSPLFISIAYSFHFQTNILCVSCLLAPILLSFSTMEGRLWLLCLPSRRSSLPRWFRGRKASRRKQNNPAANDFGGTVECCFAYLQVVPLDSGRQTGTKKRKTPKKQQEKTQRIASLLTGINVNNPATPVLHVSVLNFLTHL